MILLAIALAEASSPASPDPVRDYNLCVRRTAIRLEPSDEPVDVVAEAAKAFCTSARTAALNSTRNFKGGNAVSIDELEGAASFFAKAQAVAARLCRRARDCALNHVP